MNCRICPSCKWEFPLSLRSQKCRFCGTLFDKQWCYMCKEFVPVDQFNKYKTGKPNSYCKPCMREYNKAQDKKHPEKLKARVVRHYENRKQESEELYARWQELTKSPFKPMKEAEWLKICAFFDGCAICGHEHIDSREFFLSPKFGGKYAAWNMFPLCGKCAVLARRIENPFFWIDKTLGRSSGSLGLNDERREKLKQYLLEWVNVDGESH